MRCAKRLRSQSGFTLVELLVVLCLLSVLFSFFLQTFLFAMAQFHNRMALMELEENLAIAADAIASDGVNSIAVETCEPDSLILLTETDRIVYTIAQDLQAKEHLYKLTGKTFYRRENTQGTRQPMANFISAFCVSYYDCTGEETFDADSVDIVKVQLKGQWNDTLVQKQLIVRLKDSDYL